ncbi:MAG: hypothetical protein HRT44_05130 [Bdellovibrionales bacterium]|nr:hypothetical protein [Bdellovibrionales bacterium]NQZ18625.1 hypothetical protein [Bdellovibrionales bacterium]
MRVALLLFSFLLSLNSYGIYVEKLMGPAKPLYLQKYFDRMYKWYGEEFYNFDESMNSSEKELLVVWKRSLSSWGTQIGDDFFQENFQFSHSLENGKVDSSTLYIGLENWTVAQKLLVKKVLRSHGINEDLPSNFIGLRWSFASNEITLLSREKSEIHRIHYKEGKKIYTSQQKVAEEYTIPLPDQRKGNVSSVYVTHYSDNREATYTYRFRSIFVHFLEKPAGLYSIKHFREFRQPFNKVDLVSTKKYRVHYP